jgi:hypothetical protein
LRSRSGLLITFYSSNREAEDHGVSPTIFANSIRPANLLNAGSVLLEIAREKSFISKHL